MAFFPSRRSRALVVLDGAKAKVFRNIEKDKTNIQMDLLVHRVSIHYLLGSNWHLAGMKIWGSISHSLRFSMMVSVTYWMS